MLWVPQLVKDDQHFLLFYSPSGKMVEQETDAYSERGIDVPFGSFRRSKRLSDVEMANIGWERKSNFIFLVTIFII